MNAIPYEGSRILAIEHIRVYMSRSGSYAIVTVRLEGLVSKKQCSQTYSLDLHHDGTLADTLGNTGMKTRAVIGFLGKQFSGKPIQFKGN